MRMCHENQKFENEIHTVYDTYIKMPLGKRDSEVIQ